MDFQPRYSTFFLELINFSGEKISQKRDIKEFRGKSKYFLMKLWREVVERDVVYQYCGL